MDGFTQALNILPSEIRAEAEKYSGSSVEEIRLRCGFKPTLIISGREAELNCSETDGQMLLKIMEKITDASLHSAARSMAEGYIIYRGLRVGLCGEAVIHNNELRGFKNFSSLAIRIPRECRGIGRELIDELYRDKFENTLIISPPGWGKTSLIRELIRVLSDSGLRISVVDERNELSATVNGAAAFSLGRHSDVLINIPKATGSMMLLRGMNPEIIAMDEISTEADISAAGRIYGCGVGLLASAHAAEKDELFRRPLYKLLMELGAFKYLIRITCRDGRRTYTAERI